MDLHALEDTVIEADLAEAFPEHIDDLAFVSQLRASVSTNLENLQAVFRGRALSEIELDQPMAFGEAQAQLGIPQVSLQKSYRVGFRVMLEAWNRAVSSAAAARGTSAAEAMAAATAVSRIILQYQDHVASLVAQAHVRTDESIHQSRTNLRHRLIRDILASETELLAPSDLVAIGYSFEVQHVAVLLPELGYGAATQLITALRSATGATDSLLQPRGLAASVVWLGHVRGWPASRLVTLTDLLQRLDLVASVSAPNAGLAGFRSCVSQAQDVERVRACWGSATAPRLIVFASVALEVLLLKDLPAARRFVMAELKSLAGDLPEDRRLRQTLAASLRCGSHVSTAQALDIHEHTVRNRLQKVEERLGHPRSERTTEVQVALRAHRLITSAPG